jgi:hypothetical protein
MPTACKHANVYTKRQQLNYVTASYPIDQHKTLPVYNFYFVMYKSAKGMRHLEKLETDRLKDKVKISLRELGDKMWTKFHCLGK